MGAPETLHPHQAPPNTFDRRKARLAFLAPDIQVAILEGRQPPELTLQGVLDTPLPPLWEDQRRALGFPVVRPGQRNQKIPDTAKQVP